MLDNCIAIFVTIIIATCIATCWFAVSFWSAVFCTVCWTLHWECPSSHRLHHECSCAENSSILSFWYSSTGAQQEPDAVDGNACNLPSGEKHLTDMREVARKLRQELQKKRQLPALSNEASFGRRFDCRRRQIEVMCTNPRPVRQCTCILYSWLITSSGCYWSGDLE